MGRAVGGDLPDFFLVGAAKAGTTSLYHYLRQHPEIYMSPVKEPRYFALAGHALDFTGPGDGRLFATTKTALEDYRRLFADRGAEKVAGEASVLYLPHPDAAGAIASALPDARIVAVLRNPVERAYSGYLYRVRDGGEVGSFEEALAAEAERRALAGTPAGSTGTTASTSATSPGTTSASRPSRSASSSTRTSSATRTSCSASSFGFSESKMPSAPT